MVGTIWQIYGRTDIGLMGAALAKLGIEYSYTGSSRDAWLTVLVMGNNDLAKELRAEHVPGRAPLLAALSMAVLAARCAGKEILDGVFNDVADLDGFTAEARQSKDFGFDGKTLIHPKQVEPCNTAFAPTVEQIALSQEIIAAFEAAARDGRGGVTVNGRMIENLHVEQAQRVLAVAAAIGALD